jgi:dTDP-4-dehydrorhamnose 3,5-epimerase
MELRSPTVSTESLDKAYELSLESCEPIFVPSQYYADDRGYSLMNQLVGVLCPEGQVNYSTQYPGVIKAWHRHKDQTDFWICVRGHIKVGVHDESKGIAWMKVLGEKAPGTLIIPPPLWHGAATVGHEPAGLLYFVTKQFNAASPDEDRRAHDSVPGFPWTTQHG